MLEVADEAWKQGGVLWWNALMLRHVLRPNAWLRDQVPPTARPRAALLRAPILIADEGGGSADTRRAQSCWLQASGCGNACPPGRCLQ